MNVTHQFVKVPLHPVTNICQFHLCVFPFGPLSACEVIAGPFSYLRAVGFNPTPHALFSAEVLMIKQIWATANILSLVGIGTSLWQTLAQRVSLGAMH